MTVLTWPTQGDIPWNAILEANVQTVLTIADTNTTNIAANTAAIAANVVAIALKAPTASPTFTGTVSGITKTMVGLGNVDNTSDANKPVSTAGQTALNLKADLASPTFTGTVAGITKTMVGLGNVDNTSDANKPVSTAQAAADALKAPIISPVHTPTSAAAIGMVVRGFVSQSANLQEWQDSASTVLARVTSLGAIVGANFYSTGGLYENTAGTGSYINLVPASSAFIIGRVAAAVTSVVRGAASQTANLQEWQDSVGAVHCQVYSDGTIGSGFGQLKSVAAANVAKYLMFLAAPAADVKPLIAKGAASQTANLQEWQNSGGTVLAYIASTGLLLANGVVSTNDITTTTGTYENNARTGAYMAMVAANSVYIVARVTTLPALVVRGAASHTGDLQQWQDSAGTSLASVSSAGFIKTSTSGQVQTPLVQHPTLGGSYLNLTTSTASVIGQVAASAIFFVRGAASQTNDLQQWQNSAGTVLAKADLAGNLIGASLYTNSGIVENIAQTGTYANFLANNALVLSARNTAAAVLVAQGAASHTGSLQEWQTSAGTILANVTAAGLHRWTAAGNQQTTVGAAGGASALPATPTKYLKVVDSAGTTLVVPAYAA